ncbi:Tpk2p [Rhizophagus irregularis DAOM 197198w]|uniref:Tpk2p n=2 Tax=Rhizophagus irregularis TaxID=588596 RepID=A0A015ILX6_RHIIW|nr:Tpk2p [Rhizophagus irregularis DAOM 197198w]
MQTAKNTNEWINWIEEAVSKEYYRLYEHENFSDIQKIGTGGFGKVYRASWKNSQYFALKTFFNIDDVTAKEIVHELKLQRDIQFHDNIIKFYGIAKFDPENQNSQSNNYLLVMEYADSGSLKNYLKENFNSLTWNDKYNFAYQLSCAVSCLHNEGIMHRDLHPGNVLVHRKTIKLSDFGLSKRIESSSNSQSKLFGIIPYVDPKRFSGRRKNKSSTQIFSLNEKSDIYSIGVLFWEISSGQPPFYSEVEQYDIDLALEITQGLREEPVPDTPGGYVEIYTECWNGEPEKRPTINQVVERLEAIMTKTNITTENYQTELSLRSTSTDGQNFNPTNTLSNIDNSLHGEMSQIIQNFDKMNTREIVPTPLTNKIVEDTVNYIFKIINEGKKSTRIKNNKDILARSYTVLAQFYVGLCYETGRGTVKDEKLAFKYYEKIANMNYASGLVKIGYFYDNGIGTSVNYQKALELYKQAANLGSSMAQHNLAVTYENGDGVDIDYGKAFELYYQAANSGNGLALNNLALMYYDGKGVDIDYGKAFELYYKAVNSGYSNAQYNLALMYYNGKGVDVDYEKAKELYYQAANSGNSSAQNNLAYMYEYGKGTEEDINQAIYWYKKSANQGFQLAKNNLELRKRFFK